MKNRPLAPMTCARSGLQLLVGKNTAPGPKRVNILLAPWQQIGLIIKSEIFPDSPVLLA